MREQIIVNLADGRRAVIDERVNMGGLTCLVSIQVPVLKTVDVVVRKFPRKVRQDVVYEWVNDCSWLFLKKFDRYDLETDIPRLIRETLWQRDYGTEFKRARSKWDGKTVLLL